MRKVVAVILGLFLIGSMLIIQNVTVNANNSERTIFFDDFESYSVGNYPSSNWILDYDGAGEKYQKIVSNPVKFGSKAFQMLSAQGCWAAVSEHKFNSNADIIGFEADVWAESYGTEGCGGDKTTVIRVAFWNGDLDSWGRYYADVRFKHNGIAYAYSEGEEHQLMSWKPETWYHVKVILNRKTNTYDVYIDGRLVAEDIPVEHSDTENINAIVLTAGHANTKVVFDNVRVFEVTSGSSSGGIDLSRGLVAYYSFDHCDARDDSGNGHDGEIYGSPKCVDGVLGKAFEFDGSSYIRVPHSDDLAPPCYTVNVWFNPTETAISGESADEILAKGYDKLYYQIQWGGKGSTDDNEVEFWLENEYDEDEYVYSNPVELNRWHMATMSYCNGVLSAYIDGNLIESKHIDIIPYNSEENLYIATADSGYFKGLIDEVRIYNRALSEEEVKALYEQGASGVSPPPAQPKTVEYLPKEDLSEWKYYREVTIREQSGETLENFQVLIELDSNNFDFSKANPDGSDVRIVDENGNFLPYWIEEWNLTAKRAKIWTIVPKIPANEEVKLKLYYGNPNAESKSNGEKVFEFFDDFNGNQLDTSKWTPFHTIGDLGKANTVPIEYDGTIRVHDSFLILSISQNDWDPATSTGFSRGVKSKICLPKDSVVEAKYVDAKYAERASNNELFVGEFFTSKISKPGISFRNSVETYGSTYLFFEINQAIWDNVIGYKSKVYREGIYKLSRIGTNTWKAEFFSPQDGWFSLGTAHDNLPDTTFSLKISEWDKPRDTSVKFDWVFVRKYAPKDPVAIVGSEAMTSGETSSTSTFTQTQTSTTTTQPYTTSTPASAARSSIDTAKDIISKIPASVSVISAKTMLDEAQNAYENGNYELAKKFAETAQALAVKDYYDKLRTDVQAKENQGQDVKEVENLLQQAYDAYQSENYTKALDILIQANLALQGLQSNENNPLMKYLALLAIIGGIAVTGLLYSKNKKAEGERLRAEFEASLKSGDNIVEKDQFSALEYYSQAFGIAKKLGDPSLVAKAQEKLNTVRGTVIAEINSLITRGNEALGKSDYDKALAYYRQALNLAEKLNDRDKIREVKSKMEGVNKVRKIRELLSEGDVLMEGEKYGMALEKYEEALTIAKELGDNYLIELLKGRVSKASEVVEETNATVSSLIGQASRDMMEEDYESAIEKLSQALALAEKIGGTVSVEDIKAKLEEAKKRKELRDKLREAKSAKDYSQALGLLGEALTLAEELGDERTVARIKGEIEEVRKAKILETLKDGISLILPKEIPYGREVTLSINVENRLDETIENLTVDLSELSPYFVLGEEKITFPPIRPGRKLGKDVVIKPQFKGDFDFNVGISSSIGETVKTLKVRVGDYYAPAQFTPKPLTPKSAPEELESLYEDFKYVGEGGFARVFRAKRKRDGKVVAVKIPKTLDPATGKAFVREISNWLHLKHPNIVELYDVNVIPIPYLEMEYCEGSLAKLGRPMDIEQAAHIVFNIAEGLKYAHSKGIIHRDLKPSNVLLKAGIPKISDWGLSKVMSESKSSTLASFTPYYASPEQLSPRRFGHTDVRTDIWQLGVLFYELITGKLPFDGKDLGEVTFAIINEDPAPPSQLNPEAKIVEPIIMKMLAKRKEERYQSVEELQSDLAKVLNMTYVEGLKKSRDLKRTIFYIGDLALINLKAGNLKEALKYLLELREYAGKYRDDLDWLISQVKLAMEEGVKLGEDAVLKADVIVHQIKMGRQGTEHDRGLRKIKVVKKEKTEKTNAGNFSPEKVEVSAGSTKKGRRIKDEETTIEFEGRTYRVKWKSGCNGINDESDAQRVAQRLIEIYYQNLDQLKAKAKEQGWEQELIDLLNSPDTVSLRHKGDFRIYKDRGTKSVPRRIGALVKIKEGKMMPKYWNK